jgi:hypothetical protein
LARTKRVKASGLLNGALQVLREAQEQKSDQRDGELNAHRVLLRPRKCWIFKVCLIQRKNRSICQRRL